MQGRLKRHLVLVQLADRLSHIHILKAGDKALVEGGERLLLAHHILKPVIDKAIAGSLIVQILTGGRGGLDGTAEEGGLRRGDGIAERAAGTRIEIGHVLQRLKQLRAEIGGQKPDLHGLPVADVNGLLDRAVGEGIAG